MDQYKQGTKYHETVFYQAQEKAKLEEEKLKEIAATLEPKELKYEGREIKTEVKEKLFGKAEITEKEDESNFLYRQWETLNKENKALEKQNSQLQKENSLLKQKYADLTQGFRIVYLTLKHTAKDKFREIKGKMELVAEKIGRGDSFKKLGKEIEVKDKRKENDLSL